jgi:hypothetical protein
MVPFFFCDRRKSGRATLKHFDDQNNLAVWKEGRERKGHLNSVIKIMRLL